MIKKLFRSRDRVKLIRMGPGLDNLTGQIVGIASRHIFDTYIVELDETLNPDTPDFKGFGPVWAISVPEQCLELV